MIIKAPNPLPLIRVNGVVPRSVFLAGSIEMGAAVDWQTSIGEKFDKGEYTVFNPRRDEWNSSWVQERKNPQFFEQVTWELAALEMASCIFLYFDPNTKSPISLLELGIFAHSKKLLVGCPDGFYRKGNVEIVCERYGIPFFTGERSSVLNAMYASSPWIMGELNHN